MAAARKFIGLLGDIAEGAADLGDDAYKELLRLIKEGYPDTTAMKIVTGELPMDNASRMTRATEQGKTQRAYHVATDHLRDNLPTDQGLISFTPNMPHSSWFSESPYLSQSYGSRWSDLNSASYPVLMDTRGMETTSALLPSLRDYPSKPQHWSGIREPRVFRSDGREVVDEYNIPIYENQTMNTDSLALGSNYRAADGVVIDDVVDVGPNALFINESLRNVGIDPAEWMKAQGDTGGKVIAVNDGSKVRSLLSAAFDPDQVDTNNLLATNPAATTLAGLLTLLGISEADGLLSNNRYD